MKINIGDKIRILHMEGEPHYAGKEGVVDHIDDRGQIHLDTCGCAVIPGIDIYEVINE